MIHLNTNALIAVLVLTVPAATALRAQAPEAATDAADWQAPAAAEVRADVFNWLDRRGVDDRTRAAADALWSTESEATGGPDLLMRLVETLALADEQAGQLAELCSKPCTNPAPPRHDWLRDPKTPALVSANLRLFYGRWLARESLYDEARQQLDGLGTADVVDPASLLFYQAVVYHRLLDRQAALQAIKRLLAGGEEQSRQRYTAVARLMEADLRGVKEDSLDHIARRMEDIRRRLSLGRAGPTVRKVEDGVIESLDKLLEKLAEQQQQQSATGANSTRSSKPADESRILGGKGPGEVTKRQIGSQSGWGNLPPKRREEAMQQIGREFPSHYRDVVEQYFRKLAGEDGPGE